ncbi:MAG: hypothetical protein WCT05_08050 [Lentisphaeria bacterium]
MNINKEKAQAMLKVHRQLRFAEHKYPANLYANIRAYVIRMLRKHKGDLAATAKELRCSIAFVRKQSKLACYEQLMKNPALSKHFVWRSLTPKQWTHLLVRHPQFISHLPKNYFLYSKYIAKILIAHPELSWRFDLSKLSMAPEVFVDLLAKRPEFAGYCDFSKFDTCSARFLLEKCPQYFDRIRIESVLGYQWDLIFCRQPQLEARFATMPPEEWPINYWSRYLRLHPEAETEFTRWDEIDKNDLDFLQKEQPELYARHYSQTKNKE